LFIYSPLWQGGAVIVAIAIAIILVLALVIRDLTDSHLLQQVSMVILVFTLGIRDLTGSHPLRRASVLSNGLRGRTLLWKLVTSVTSRAVEDVFLSRLLPCLTIDADLRIFDTCLVATTLTLESIANARELVASILEAIGKRKNEERACEVRWAGEARRRRRMGDRERGRRTDGQTDGQRGGAQTGSGW
jgi:hypothetical protein